MNILVVNDFSQLSYYYTGTICGLFAGESNPSLQYILNRYKAWRTGAKVHTHYHIPGYAPIDLMLSQIGTRSMISASWTPPPAPPSNGYRITVDSEDFSAGIDTMSSSQNISVSFGVHTIRVQSRSIHFPGGIATMDITVIGNGHVHNTIIFIRFVCFKLTYHQKKSCHHH